MIPDRITRHCPWRRPCGCRKQDNSMWYEVVEGRFNHRALSHWVVDYTEYDCLDCRCRCAYCGKPYRRDLYWEQFGSSSILPEFDPDDPLYDSYTDAFDWTDADELWFLSERTYDSPDKRVYHNWDGERESGKRP